MNALRFVLASLAAYSVARMIAFEDGFSLPIGRKDAHSVGLFKRLRIDLHDKLGSDHALAQGVKCPMCIAFWLSILCTPFVLGYRNRLQEAIIVTSALRGMTVIFIRYFG